MLRVKQSQSIFILSFEFQSCMDLNVKIDFNWEKRLKFPFTAFWIAQVKITQMSDIEKSFTLFHDAFDICSRLDISFSDISNDQLFVPHLNGQLL